MPPSGRAAVAIILTASLLLLNNVSASEETYNASPQVTADDFLRAHNEVRAKYNEPMLSWDEKLALFAHLWALKTSALGKCEERYHSNGPFGENLFWGWSWNDNFSPRDAVMMWANEKNDFDVKSLHCSPGKMCGHFTQVVWRNSKRVGCSRIKCAKGGVLMICNYDPPGNWIDAKLGGLMNPFGVDQTPPAAIPLELKTPLLPLPIPVLPRRPMLPAVPAVGQPALPHRRPALIKGLPRRGRIGGRRRRRRRRRERGRGGHHPGRAQQNRNDRNPNRNRHHLSSRQRMINRIRRRQHANSLSTLTSQLPPRSG